MDCTGWYFPRFSEFQWFWVRPESAVPLDTGGQSEYIAALDGVVDPPGI
ncbi:MAG: hypothetical protein ACI9JM_000460 [Halioglobus sp.]|jgi:hypothetical protein